MADLFFKINADYEELIRMQREAAKLKAEMSDFSGSKEEFEDLNKRLAKLSESISKTSEQVAKDFQNAFSINDVDFSDVAKGIEGFDKDILTFTGNLQRYFRDSQKEIEGTLRSVQDMQVALASVDVTPSNYESIKQAQTTLAEVSEEIQRQQAVLGQNQAAWQEVANAVENGTRVQMEHIASTQNFSNGALEGSLKAQEAGLEQIIKAEEIQAEVTAADRMEVERLGQQALSTITNLQSMSQVLASMGVVDTGFAEQVSRLEESALSLGGTTNVEVAQQIANEVAQVFERAMAEWNRIKEQGITQKESAEKQTDDDYLLEIGKEKEAIQGIRERRTEEKQAYTEKLAALESEKAKAQEQVAAWKEELDIQEARKQKFEEINQAIAAAKANGEQSIPFNGGQVPVDVAESYTAANSNDAEIAEAREEMAGYIEDAKKAKDAITELNEAEARSAMEAHEQIQQKTQLVEQYRQQLSDSAAHELEQAEKREAAEAREQQREQELEAQRAQADAARQAAIQKNDADTLKQIDELQRVIDKEKERLDVLRQQAEQAAKNYEQTVQNNQFKPSDVATSLVGGGVFAKSDRIEAAGVEMDAKNSEYSAQAEVVQQLQSELDALVGKLSEAGTAQYAETEKIREAKAEREALLPKIQAERETLEQSAEANKRVGGALSETSEAMKRMNLDNLKKMVQQSNSELDMLANKLSAAKRAMDAAELNKAAAAQRLEMGGNDAQIGKLVEDYKKAQEQVEATKRTLSETAEEYNKTKAYQAEINVELQKASEHHVRMRTQIMNVREELSRMVEAGQQGTPEFYRMAQQAGALRRQMNLANAQMQYFATPQRGMAQMKSTLQGVAGGFGAITGVMGLFNSKSEKMAEIQTKIQSVMAIIVGLETAYNLVKKTSIARIGLEIAAQSLANLARASWAAITGQATAAQIAFNAAMAANPIGAIIVVVAAAAAAIYGLYKVLSQASEEAKFAKEEMEHTGEVAEEFRKSVAKAVGEQVSKYKTLKNEWVGLRSELEKNKFIKDHEKDFHDLGAAIDNVSDATRFFSDEGTKAFNAACVARAKAMAAAAAATQEFQRAIEAQMEIDSLQKILDSSKNFSQFKQNLTESGYDVDDMTSMWRTFEGELENVRKIQRERQRVVDAANRKGAEYLTMSENFTKEYEQAYKRAGIRRYEGGSRSTSREGRAGSASGGGKTKDAFEDKRAKEVEEEEKNRKREFDKRRKLDQEALKAEQSAAKKRAMQRKMDLQDTEEYYRSLELQRIADEKAKYDEDHKNDKNRTSYYDSAQYKNHFLDEKDEFNDKMNKLNLKAYENEMQFYANLREVQQKMSESEELQRTLQSVEAFFDERVRIEKKYIEQREKIRKAQEQGAIDEATANILTENVNKQQAAEEKKVGYDKFNNSPLLAAAMTSSQTTYDELSDYREQFDTMISDALQEATVADFKGILDSYTKLTDEMASKNPFGEMIASAQELQAAEQELETETGKLEDLYKDLGTDSKGEESGKMKAAHKEADDAADALQAATVMRELAEQNLSDANQNFIDAQADGATDEELASLVAAQEGASNALVKAIQNEDEARKNASVSSQKYADMLNQVSQQEDKVRKANMKVQTQQKRSDKATKASISTIKQWASAIKSAAGEFQSPVASAISGMMDLTTTTLDSIEAMKQSGYGAAKGVEKVAKAVTNAVAILAIIQAAWQVINQIMSLFTGKDEEEYKKRVDGLKSEIDALDYSFNALKEDMDNAWGTEAIDAYIKAVETLNDRQKAQLDLIKAQATAHVGHHSLTHYMKEQAGITDKELEEAKKKIKELGGDVSSGWITDWLYSLSAEQLAAFMKDGIGITIMGKLGGVSGTGDYSGSDWREDMQAYADSAKTVEDLADEMAEKLNGISLDGLKDEFKELVTTFDTSFNDINNSFDEFMREAAFNKARTQYDENLKKFYDDLAEINNLYTEGEISDEEYRKRIAEMRERYKNLVKGAQDDYQQELTDAGINVKNLEQSATSGGFEAMSEDTGTELNGRFAAMQAQETITAENTSQLLVMTGAVHDIASELRDVQVNSYLELREISENTKKVVEPILTMQEDIKKIKENTESL